MKDLINKLSPYNARIAKQQIPFKLTARGEMYLIMQFVAPFNQYDNFT
jgi:hypothetical protein